MEKDSTLDSFLGGSVESDETDEETPSPASVSPQAEGAPTSASVSPATSTYAWSPEGVACAVCDEVVTRRWRDGDELVCESCKSW
ncbi:hypothetical protein ACFQH3_13555 [Haladaptatus sp. GCM10025707]|uniref:DUF7573 domain-containing protein n=1 Tax=unclassified Haladaptatus TaxID=2622732 RepID=UPI0023E831DE|nr:MULTISPECIES: hypothetical protein [unclassified Haladaptatus]